MQNGTAETGNAFFNTIYIQDDAGNGINVFPIDDNNIRRGDQVMITGSISEYIGDKQLSAINVTVLEGSKEVIISDATTKEADDYEANFGKLVRVEGVVQSVKLANGIVESIELQDESGQSCRVFIDGYISYSDDASPELEGFVKEGATISAVGFVSHDAEGNRLRVRDRSEIKAEEQSPVSENYDVIFALANGAADGALKAEGGKDYAATLKPADGYALPETVKVTVGGAELPSEGYSYNAVTGELMIYGLALREIYKYWLNLSKCRLKNQEILSSLETPRHQMILKSPANRKIRMARLHQKFRKRGMPPI